MNLSESIDQSLSVAEALDKGECGGSYLEATILLSAIASGLAAYCWPGKGSDRRRFIELWVRYGGEERTLISVPLLAQSLRRKSKDTDADAIEELVPNAFGPGHGSRIVSGGEIDRPETEILRVSSSLKSVDVRRFSYPAIFYKSVRSALVHEFAIRDTASAWTMSSSDGVSYLNVIERGQDISRREIHFPVRWTCELVRDLSGRVEDMSIPLSPPSTWWIDG